MNSILQNIFLNSFDNLSLNQYFNFEINTFFWLDLAIVGLLVWILFRFLHRTRGERIIWGIFILALMWALAVVLRLQLLVLLLRLLFASFIVAIPVVFQPELRSGLERLGRSTRFVADWRKLSQGELEYLIEQIIEAVRILARNRFGAIIVLTRQSGLKEFIEESEPIYSRLGSRLITSIFYPKNPLHDGAIIIVGNRIAAARVTLPLSEEADLTLGTRHRAALGIAQQTDAVAIVVSEESGKISLAYDGKFNRRITYDKLASELRKLLGKTYSSGAPKWREST